MPIFLVLADTERITGATDRLADVLKDHGESFRLYEGSFLLATDKEHAAVYRELKRRIGCDDNRSLLVVTVPEPYIGRAPRDVKAWLLRQSEKLAQAERSKRRSSDGGPHSPDT